MINQMLDKIHKNFKRIDINFITDEQMLKLNNEFLNHNTFTDILTFSYNEVEPYSSEIYISFERAYENSIEFNEKFENEILRLISHGLLHSIGYKDKTDSQKNRMRKAEKDLLKSVNKVKFIKKFEIEKVK